MKFLQKKVEFFSNWASTPYFTIYCVSALKKWKDAPKKDGFPTHFHRIYHYWKFQHDSEIFKNRPLGLGLPERGRAGHSGSPERLNFSKFQNRVETFRNNKFDEYE